MMDNSRRESIYQPGAGVPDRRGSELSDTVLAPGGPEDNERALQDINLLQLSYETLGQSIQYHIADTTRRLNTRTPIHHLPNELLVNIFALTLVIDLEDLMNRPYKIISLSLVSKAWNRIIYETPSLWAQISSAYSDRENKVAVLRSKEAPLRVYCLEDHFRDEKHGGMTKFVNLASREAYRWRVAEFIMYPDVTVHALRNFVSLSVPMMEELKIDFGRPAKGLFTKGTVDIFGGKADHLRYVELRNFSILWSSQLLSRLETLKISSLRTQLGPSISQIIHILHQCPELRAFQLRCPNVLATGAMSSEMEAVHLPSLISFSLSLDDANAFSRIVTSVRIPACKEFTLWCCNVLPNILSNEASHFTAVLLSVIQSAPGISLTLQGSMLDLKSRSAIDIHQTSDSPWLIDLATGSISWPSIDAEIVCNTISFPQVADLLRKMPSITKLALIGDSDQYISYLSYPTLNNGIYEWVLPNLRELSLEYCPKNTLQPLVDLSDKREQGAEMDRGDEVQLGLPMKLEMIYVEMMSGGSFYKALRELKGDLWDGYMIDQ
ncbi:hypothetical protein FRB95_009465 [Tulasnella sp. JGI-2019a]|nr:hypothetical protein FRB95_009465 [Tulasnella sp. JGI-2019a]